MQRSRFVSVFSLFLALCMNAAEPVQAEEFAGQRWAVLIGVDDYAQIADLNYCGADMLALRDQLITV